MNPNNVDLTSFILLRDGLIALGCYVFIWTARRYLAHRATPKNLGEWLVEVNRAAREVFDAGQLLAEKVVAFKALRASAPEEFRPNIDRMLRVVQLEEEAAHQELARAGDLPLRPLFTDEVVAPADDVADETASGEFTIAQAPRRPNAWARKRA